jgi:hypothetical protein
MDLLVTVCSTSARVGIRELREGEILKTIPKPKELVCEVKPSLAESEYSGDIKQWRWPARKYPMVRRKLY